MGRHRVAHHDHLPGVEAGVEGVGQQGAPVQLDRGLVGPVEAHGGAPGQHHGAEGRVREVAQVVGFHASRMAAAPAAGRLVSMTTLRVALVQEASDTDPAVNRARLAQVVPEGHDLVVLPLHGRGNKGGKGDGVRTLAYHKPSDAEAKWSTTVIDDRMHMSHNFEVAQWDKDAANEMLLAGLEGVFLLNPAIRGGWTRQQISNNPTGEVRQGAGARGEKFIAAIEPMHGNQLSVYTAAKGNKLWSRNVITDSLDQGHALATGDFLGTGSDQIVVGWRGTRRTGKVGVRLFYPTNEQRTEWKSLLIDDNQMATEDIRVADLNGDGKPDIVAAGRATHNLKIYFNE